MVELNKGEVIRFQTTFEEIAAEIPIHIVNKDDLFAQFGEVLVVSKGTTDYCINIYTDSGTFTEQQISTLRDYTSAYINYNGQIYRLGLRTPNAQKYFSTMAHSTDILVVTVDMTNSTWMCSIISSEISQHIDDNVRHITSNERTIWNNKLNCEDSVQEERLILNRN